MLQKVRTLIRFFANKKFALCVCLAWFVTNGWSYALLFLGNRLHIGWMQKTALAYIALLWLPATPEKIATFALAIALLRLFFPKDEKTLALLRELLAKAKKRLSPARKSGTRKSNQQQKQ